MCFLCGDTKTLSKFKYVASDGVLCYKCYKEIIQSDIDAKGSEK